MDLDRPNKRYYDSIIMEATYQMDDFNTIDVTIRNEIRNKSIEVFIDKNIIDTIDEYEEWLIDFHSIREKENQLEENKRLKIELLKQIEKNKNNPNPTIIESTRIAVQISELEATNLILSDDINYFRSQK